MTKAQIIDLALNYFAFYAGFGGTLGFFALVVYVFNIEIE